MNGAASGRKNSGGAQRISIAILAMGGQGGGVLADWVVALAEAQGWAAQSTSVPGVAQRTGATIYYIEMAPMRAGAQPVFALMPTPGDVDVVMASELMEAGRSVLRGLVTPEQTTLIASTHRAFAVAEKENSGRRRRRPLGRLDRDRICREAPDCVRHGGHRESGRQRHFGGDVRRARRDQSAPV